MGGPAVLVGVSCLTTDEDGLGREVEVGIGRLVEVGAVWDGGDQGAFHHW